MKKLTVNLKAQSYDLVIEKGIFENIEEEISQVYKNKKISIITDDNVYQIYGEKLEKILENSKFEIDIIKVKAGEDSKSFTALEKIYKKLLDFNLTRGDLLLAFGGGVVGDLGGFAAATYLRGIDYIQVPTTLLAQIDSSIGGKVGINLQEGKNLVGNFHHPKKVIIDPDFLKTLEERYIKDGLGEVIKYACIKDTQLFDKLMAIKNTSQLFDNIEDIIFTCCSIKQEVVEKDEKDRGGRMILNFGHTFAHGIERSTNYNYSHGEAVAVGMYNITLRSEELGFTKSGTSEKIKEILENFNIDFKLPNIVVEGILNSIKYDKKNISGFINLILLEEIGSAVIKKIKSEEAKNFLGGNLVKKNIVLIGMPGCGKTTLGGEIAKKLNKNLIDMDIYIEENEKKTIKEMFAVDENIFRDAETKYSEKLSRKYSHIIATGGGIVKRKENISHLRKNSVIVFLNRPLENIFADIDTDTRPLLADGKKVLTKLYNERIDLYKEYCDLEIKNIGTISDVADNIIEKVLDYERELGRAKKMA